MCILKEAETSKCGSDFQKKFEILQDNDIFDIIKGSFQNDQERVPKKSYRTFKKISS